MRNDFFRAAFPGRLAALRKAAHITQTELGVAIGLSYKTAQRTIAKWEGGETSPTMQHARPLATALNCTLDDLIP